ncbi:MAG: hypothetical protein HKN57_08850 [Xanthomonadales bacterium]|nr:DUF308 domain-containing protein [Gammaproteobacteria bacterium]MBT8053639.1 DUF308 domain-containing protein [Gammaproteobacteria bacterium]NND57349.1 hypothetical protein [Xanthomonadales bacterium]NNK51784.1 hypothetical protein [Xanthomonadales bacterium]
MNAKSLPGNKMLMTIGIVMVLLGLLLLISPAAVGAAVVKLVALVLVVTGVAQLVQGLQAGRAAHSIISAVLGLIVAGVGIMVWMNPALGSSFLTALLMLFFVVHGLYKLSAAIRYRGVGGWLWLLFSGLVSLLFVYLLWKQWPLSGAWAIGVLVGLDLLLTGLAMMVLAVAVKKARSVGYFDTIRL